MATRDRTALFLRYREEAAQLHKRKPTYQNEDISNDSSQTIIRKTAMQPEWIFTYNDLKTDMNQLEQILNQLSSLYAKHLLPSFGDTDTTDIERDIRESSLRLNELLHTVEHKIRSISKLTKNHSNQVENQICQNIQTRYATPLQQFSMSFRKKQKRYLEKLKEIREAYSDSPQTQRPTFLIDDDDNDQIESNGFHNSSFSDQQMITVENASELAEERTRELNRVATNINDLATLVKDIASLVVDQGTVLDRIDYNLEDVKITTNSAVRELRITDRYQRKRHAFCCIIILAIACAVMFMILVFKWTS